MKLAGEKVEKPGKGENFHCTWGKNIIFEKGVGANIWENVQSSLSISHTSLGGSLLRPQPGSLLGILAGMRIRNFFPRFRIRIRP